MMRITNTTRMFARSAKPVARLAAGSTRTSLLASNRLSLVAVMNLTPIRGFCAAAKLPNSESVTEENNAGKTLEKLEHVLQKARHSDVVCKQMGWTPEDEATLTQKTNELCKEVGADKTKVFINQMVDEIIVTNHPKSAMANMLKQLIICKNEQSSVVIDLCQEKQLPLALRLQTKFILNEIKNNLTSEAAKKWVTTFLELFSRLENDAVNLNRYLDNKLGAYYMRDMYMLADESQRIEIIALVKKYCKKLISHESKLLEDIGRSLEKIESKELKNSINELYSQIFSEISNDNFVTNIHDRDMSKSIIFGVLPFASSDAVSKLVQPTVTNIKEVATGGDIFPSMYFSRLLKKAEGDDRSRVISALAPYIQGTWRTHPAAMHLMKDIVVLANNDTLAEAIYREILDNFDELTKAKGGLTLLHDCIDNGSAEFKARLAAKQAEIIRDKPESYKYFALVEKCIQAAPNQADKEVLEQGMKSVSSSSTYSRGTNQPKDIRFEDIAKEDQDSVLDEILADEPKFIERCLDTRGSWMIQKYLRQGEKKHTDAISAKVVPNIEKLCTNDAGAFVVIDVFRESDSEQQLKLSKILAQLVTGNPSEGLCKTLEVILSNNSARKDGCLEPIILRVFENLKDLFSHQDKMYVRFMLKNALRHERLNSSDKVALIQKVNEHNLVEPILQQEGNWGLFALSNIVRPQESLRDDVNREKLYFDNLLKVGSSLRDYAYKVGSTNVPNKVELSKRFEKLCTDIGGANPREIVDTLLEMFVEDKRKLQDPVVEVSIKKLYQNATFEKQRDFKDRFPEFATKIERKTFFKSN